MTNIKIWSGSQKEYDELSIYDPDTLYFVDIPQEEINEYVNKKIKKFLNNVNFFCNVNMSGPV
jgi:hypothetical protein